MRLQSHKATRVVNGNICSISHLTHLAPGAIFDGMKILEHCLEIAAGLVVIMVLIEESIRWLRRKRDRKPRFNRMAAILFLLMAASAGAQQVVVTYNGQLYVQTTNSGGQISLMPVTQPIVPFNGALYFQTTNANGSMSLSPVTVINSAVSATPLPAQYVTQAPAAPQPLLNIATPVVSAVVPNYAVPSGYSLVPNGQIATGAPVNTNGPPTTQSIYQTALAYVSQFNTNLMTFSTNSPAELWTGPVFEKGIQIGALTGVDYKPFSKAPGLFFGDAATLAATVGTVAADEVDFGYAIRHYDLEVKLFAGAVDQFSANYGNQKGLGGSVGAQVEKALTDNTFAGFRLEDIFGQKQNEFLAAIVAGTTF